MALSNLKAANKDTVVELSKHLQASHDAALPHEHHRALEVLADRLTLSCVRRQPITTRFNHHNSMAGCVLLSTHVAWYVTAFMVGLSSKVVLDEHSVSNSQQIYLVNLCANGSVLARGLRHKAVQ